MCSLKITFPSLGNTSFAAKAIFSGLKIDYVMPPDNSKKILEAGSIYSPEEICLPFKLMLGGFLDSINKGADTVLLTGSCGPCRYGEYCELQMNILKKLSYDVKFVVMDYPKDITTKELLNRINYVASFSPLNNVEKLKVLKKAHEVIKLIDFIERKARYYAGYEINRGQCMEILKRCKSEALETETPDEMLNVLKSYKNAVNNIPIDKNKDPLKIAIMGEIYTILEPFSNMFIEDRLMERGISTIRHLTPSWWVSDAAMSSIGINSLDIRRASKKYMPYYIGGHAKECIGEAVLAKEKGYQGAIQIFPMGCMPEIVSKAVLPLVSREEDIPILTLIVDEMTGEAGFYTRVEAFIDLLERRRNHVLSWC